MIYICIRLTQTKILNFNSIKQNVLRTISNLLFRKRKQEKKRDNTCSWVKLYIIVKQGRRRSCVFHITRTTMNPSFYPFQYELWSYDCQTQPISVCFYFPPPCVSLLLTWLASIGVSGQFQWIWSQLINIVCKPGHENLILKVGIECI